MGSRNGARSRDIALPIYGHVKTLGTPNHVNEYAGHHTLGDVTGADSLQSDLMQWSQYRHTKTAEFVANKIGPKLILENLLWETVA